jgi:polysaccharide deacetylase family protein (PEP-CTERM system associated)
MKNAKTHVLSVVLEDYFHAPAFRGVIHERSWGRFESRYQESAQAALALLAHGNSHATFFVDAWMAQKCPSMLRDILQHGHEIALSGARGPGYRTLSPEQFRERVRRSRAAVEQACGHEVIGYRRSDVLLTPRHLWALEILADEGFRYDSSLSPTAWAFRKQPWRRFVHHESFGTKSIWEFPLSSQLFAGLMIPFAGGNYFRQYPKAFVRWSIRQWDRSRGHPLVLYFRLWDLDPEQPHIQTGSLLRDLRHYRNGDRMVEILRDLFREYHFQSIAGFLDHQQRPLAEVEPAPETGIPLDLTPPEPNRKRVNVSIVVPCYNEEDSIAYLARALDELKSELSDAYQVRFIVVDDGSTDQTARLLRQQFGSWPDVLLLRHPRNQGVSAAILTGLRQSDEIACSMDCDCSYDPRELKPMLALFKEGVDLVTASPYHPLGHVTNVPAWRIGLSRGASLLYRLVTGRKLYTFTSCLRVYRRSTALDTPLRQPGFLGIAELAGKFALGGRNIVEHPATLELRIFGTSKMKVARTIGGHVKLLTSLAQMRAAKPAVVQSVERGEAAALPGESKDAVTISTRATLYAKHH